LLHTSSQYADIPLGFLFLAAVVLFSLHDAAEGETPGLLVLAGMVLGLAAWTKNEGMLFLVVMGSLRILVSLSKRKPQESLHELIYLGTGAAPFILLVGYFKLFMAPPNDLITGTHGVDYRLNLLDLEKHGMILTAFAHQVVHFGLWFIHPLLFLILYLLFSRRKRTQVKAGVAFSGWVLLSVLAGYYILYLVQPLNLAYLLDASLNRLLLQLWPVFLFHIFLREYLQVADAAVVGSRPATSDNHS
jgi:hypothetical protein